MGAEVSCRCNCRDGAQVSDFWYDEAIAVVDTPLVGKARTKLIEKRAFRGRYTEEAFQLHSPYTWGRPGKQVTVDLPRDTDPPFLRTVAPSGTSWSQYTRTRTSFIDPRTDALAGPWAECAAWAVIYDRLGDRCDPIQQVGEAAWSVMSALEKALAGNHNKPAIMLAARKVEAAAKRLMEDNEPMPVINQVLPMPAGACPGQLLRVENPQTPGTYIIVQVPPFAHPGQQVLTPTPVQPNRKGCYRMLARDSLRLGGQPAVGCLVCKTHGFNSLPETPPSWSKLGDTGGDEILGEWSSEGIYFHGASDAFVSADIHDALEDVGEFSAHVAGDAGDAVLELF